MLEIFGNNKKFDLPDDIEVTVTWENPFLLQDRIPLTYSMSFDLPPTSGNLANFKNPNRLNSIGSWERMPGFFRFNGITFSMGNILLTEVEKSLNTSYIGSLVSDNLTKKLPDLNSIANFLYSFGPGNRFDPDFASGWAQAYKNAIFNNAAVTKDKFAACPVRVKNEEWKFDEAGYGNYNLSKLYLNMWNVNQSSYIFWDATNPVSGVIFPQPYIHYLLDQVFQGSLNDNLFRDDAELSTLCMVSTFHTRFADNIMSIYRGILLDNDYTTDDIDNYMYLSSFLNKYAFNEFLKDILKIFCASLLPRPDGKLDIVHNQVILDSTDIVDWSDKLVGTLAISLEKGKSYEYGYQGEDPGSEDQHYSFLTDIDALLSAGEGTYQIQDTGEVFDKLESEPGIFTYERQATNLGGKASVSNDDKETFSISSAVRPIPMCIAEYWWLNNNVVKYPWYVAEFPDDRYKNDSPPYIGFMRGFYDLVNKTFHTSKQAYPAKQQPFLTPYNRDMSGNQIGDYSLAWEGPDGLMTKFHTGFKTYIESDKHFVKGKFKLTELDLKNISFKKKYHARGTTFFIKKITAVFRTKTISLVDIELKEAN